MKIFLPLPHVPKQKSEPFLARQSHAAHQAAEPLRTLNRRSQGRAVPSAGRQLPGLRYSNS